jgi:lantibiotic leader peptide-processing serine protease
MTRIAPRLSAVISAALALAGGGCSHELPLSPHDEASALEARRAGVGHGQRADGHIILLKDAGTADFTAVVQRAGGKIRRSYPEISVLFATGLSGAAVAQLARRPEVLGVSPNLGRQWIPPIKPQGFRRLAQRRLHPTSDQSGAAFFDAFQWNLRVTRADDAWLTTNQGAGALVCVLDTGIDPNHIDLIGRVDPSTSASFVPSEAALTDFNGHGTINAGIITSNGIGIASVAPDATLCSIKVLDRTGFGTFEEVIAGIVHAAEVGADVANMSFGDYLPKDDPVSGPLIDALQRALSFASRHGVLLVAAAGNAAVNTNTDPKKLIFIPAEQQHVISVGATAPVAQQNFDRIAGYSNFGRSGVDVFAPGGDFVVDSVTGEGSVLEDLIIAPCSTMFDFFDCSDGATYLFAAGTSQAAPHVSGEGAVIESEFADNRKDEFLTHCILKSADAVTGRSNDPLYGDGRINVLRGATCKHAPAPSGVALLRPR